MIAYLVTESGGEFDDKWTENIAVALDKTIADAIVEFAKLSRGIDVFLIKLMKDIQEFNDKQVPTIQYVTDVKVPRWSAGMGKQAITEEMRRERDAIVAQNKVKNDEYGRLRADRDAKIHHLSIAAFMAHGYSADVAEHYYEQPSWKVDGEVYFEIEEILFVK